MPQTRVRVVGSGFTTLQYQGRDIAWLESFTDTGQRPLGGGAGGAGYEAITPIGARRPVEIVTGRVLTAGTITASIRELWDSPVWYQFGLVGQRTITDVWEALAQRSTDVTCQMLIKPPQGRGGVRGKVYHGCVITAISDGEDVTVGALSVAREIQIAYTHTTSYGGR